MLYYDISLDFGLSPKCFLKVSTISIYPSIIARLINK